ncbi:MAG: iron-containing alcohol dehydrogenase [Ruminococcaceae bacterium]|nr:iron-containing alcohol dehydrogenase [Oscillospiraceae bacterium]
MKDFRLKTQLCFRLDALSRMDYKKVLLVTDSFFVQNGTAEKIRQLCKNAQLFVFDKVQPDPPLALIADGVAILTSFLPDAIIALGGGSAIDCAKGILAMSESNAKLIAIPTTSGTGSEVTSFAILTHNGIKHPLVDNRLRPDMAILDASLLEKLPKSLIADSGMDAVAHCLEALAATSASPFSDALASHALRLLVQKLPASFEGDAAVREEIHCAATMAGIAFDHAGLGICHSLSHALGGQFHLPHGKLNAILLPSVIRFNGVQHYQRFTPQVLLTVERLRRVLALPESLHAAGLQRNDVLQHLDAICDAALCDPCTKTNPRSVKIDNLKRIVREVL